MIEAKGAELVLRKLGLHRYETARVLDLWQKEKRRVDRAAGERAPTSMPQANHA